jgi:hypothetical protein
MCVRVHQLLHGLVSVIVGARLQALCVQVVVVVVVDAAGDRRIKCIARL